MSLFRILYVIPGGLLIPLMNVIIYKDLSFIINYMLRVTDPKYCLLIYSYMHLLRVYKVVPELN